jgi:hypothetical protein
MAMEGGLRGACSGLPERNGEDRRLASRLASHGGVGNAIKHLFLISSCSYGGCLVVGEIRDIVTPDGLRTSGFGIPQRRGHALASSTSCQHTEKP